MKKLILLCTSLFAMTLFFSASPVRAQTVLWVSATGSGTTCSAAAPCGTFQTAINAGATEIHCLNSGNYGSVILSGSIMIDCGTGNIGTISIASGDAITIDGGQTIILRHLSLNGNGSASLGIWTNINYSGELFVEDCQIQGFVNHGGIQFTPTGGRGLLHVSNSQIFNNDTGIGIFGTQIVSLTLNKVELVGNNVGLLLSGFIVAGAMRDSIVGSNTQEGVLANASQVFFTVEESSVVNNLTTGIEVNSALATVNLAASTLSGNGTGVQALAGSIVSFGDNHINANAIDGTFTRTQALK